MNDSLFVLVALTVAGCVVWTARRSWASEGGALDDARERCFSSAPTGERIGIPVTRAFLFADLSGFAASAEARGDVEAARLADRFTWLTRQALCGGAELVKTLGDGVMIAAERPEDAVRTAVALARLVATESDFLPVATGVHVGTAIALADDYVGRGVNVAARVAEHAGPGQVLCTETVARVVEGLDELRLEPLGTSHLRHMSEPAVLYRLSAPNPIRLMANCTPTSTCSPTDRCRRFWFRPSVFADPTTSHVLGVAR